MKYQPTWARESRARDVYATTDDVTTPYEPLYVIVSVIVWFRNLSIEAETKSRHFPDDIFK